MSGRHATTLLVLTLAPALAACAGKKGQTQGPNDWEAAEPNSDMMSTFDQDAPDEGDEGGAEEVPSDDDEEGELAGPSASRTGAPGGEVKPCGQGPRVGGPAPELDLPLAGREGRLDLSTLSGQVVLINYWGTWCGPCLRELPRHEALVSRYSGRGLALVAIATDEDEGEVLDAIGGLAPSALVAYGASSGLDGRPLPVTLLVDRAGEVRADYVGFRPECETHLETVIQAALE